METIESLRLLTEAIEGAGADIAPTYSEYLQLAFALAADCGEAGRVYFHRICRLSPKYRGADAEKLYSNALHTGRGDVHLGTVYWLAAQAGVDTDLCGGEPVQKNVNNVNDAKMHAMQSPSHTHARAYNTKKGNRGGEDMPEEPVGTDPLVPLPVFDGYGWPEPLRSILPYGTTQPRRDVLLLGALTALGTCMGKNVICSYGGKYISPCLQTFIVAPAASGKGVLSFVRLLVAPVHDEMRRQANEQMEAYRKERLAYSALGKERGNVPPPVMPPNRMFFISGNNTGTGILENIMDSDGNGLIFEPEADTLSASIASDYGHWSDTLRKCFDHERLSYNRRTDHEYREVAKSYVGVLISGTPAQVAPLIPSAENGLFSRQLFYSMPAVRDWQNQFDTDEANLETVFAALGRQWKKPLEDLRKNCLYRLELTAAQRDEFNAVFDGLFRRAGWSNGGEMNSSVARLAVNVLRMQAVVAVLRVLEQGGPGAIGTLTRPAKDVPADNVKDVIVTSWSLGISTEDFRAVLAMAEPLVRHTQYILTFLPVTEVNRRSSANRDAFFDGLGTEFTRAEMLARAEELHINPNTVLSWLQRLVAQGLVEHGEKTGSYRKRI